MGVLIFLLVCALILMALLWYRERERREDAVERYALDMLREHNNLADGLRELHEAEARALRDMDEAVKNGR